jgi:hypothetical protein
LDGIFESEAEDLVSSAFHSEMDSDEAFFSDYGIESDYHDDTGGFKPNENDGEFNEYGWLSFTVVDDHRLLTCTVCVIVEIIPVKFLVGECFVRENVRILFHMRSKAALLSYLRCFAGMRSMTR